MSWEDEVRLKVIDTQTGKRFDVSPKSFKQLYLDHGSRIQLDGTEGANADYAHFADFGRKKARKIEPESIDASNYNSSLSSPIEPAFKSVPTGRGAPAYQPRSTGRGVPSHQPMSTGRGAPAYQPVSTGRGVPAYQPVSTDRGVVPTGETSPVRGYTGYIGDTRGVQESWWDGTDMGQGLNYMDQFPQVDGSDDSMREYMMGRRDMSGTIYDPTPSNFVPNAILNKTYTPTTEQQTPKQNSIWSDAYGSLNSIYDKYSPQLESIWNNVPDMPTPDAFSAGEYVLDNYAQPVQNFFEGSLQGMSTAYDDVSNNVSDIWGSFFGSDDEIKSAALEKETKDAYVEEVRKRYESYGFPWNEKEIKYAERQYEKEKAQGLL